MNDTRKLNKLLEELKEFSEMLETDKEMAKSSKVVEYIANIKIDIDDIIEKYSEE